MKRAFRICETLLWRCHPDSDRGMKVLQTFALPLGYGTRWKWSGRRGSDPRPPPWQGGALPTELLPHKVCLGAESNHRHADFQSTALPAELPRHMATRKGLEPSTSSVTGWRTNQLYYRATFVNGNNRARTCDPLLVRQMLSQLSYAPTFAAFCCRFPRAHHRGDKRYNTLYRAFCQYLFSKKIPIFSAAASGSTDGAEERCHSTRKSAAFRDRRLNVCPSYPGGGRQ